MLIKKMSLKLGLPLSLGLIVSARRGVHSMLVLAACFALSARASADEFSMANTWLNQILKTPLPISEIATDHELVVSILVDDFPVVLEQTPLAELASELGGTVHRSGEAGEAMEWLCMTDRAATLWIYSDGEMGQGLVTAMAIEEGSGDADIAGCSSVNVLPPMEWGVPLIGQTSEATQIVMGKAAVNGAGWFGYQSTTPSSVGETFTKQQDLAYAQDPYGIINAVGIMQMTSD